jgi:hypothetical protein
VVKKKINIWVFAVVLAILLLCCVVYIGITSYRQARNEALAESFRSGAQYGYESAVKQIMQSALNCQQMSVYAGNVTMQLIDASCLQ